MPVRAGDLARALHRFLSGPAAAALSYLWRRFCVCHHPILAAWSCACVKPITDERRRTLAKIAIDWAAYDLREKAFEEALGKAKATLLDHPLPNGGVLSKATDEQIALAAKQFEQRGQDLLDLADWLLAKRSAPTHLTRAPDFSLLLNVLQRATHRA
jgi:hypothetical protein